LKEKTRPFILERYPREQKWNSDQGNSDKEKEGKPMQEKSEFLSWLPQCTTGAKSLGRLW
jgi:hypothetical protein